LPIRTLHPGDADYNRASSWSDAFERRWRYRGNIGIGDIEGRLSRAGAKTGGIQVSIAWNTIDDIDLHVIFKDDFGLSYISWMNKHGRCGGMLDVDMNANHNFLVDKPVENIFWPIEQTPHGEFLISVHNFRNWSKNYSTPVTVIVKIDNDIKTYQVQPMYGAPPREVTRFKR
jgi:hypothetical protein